MIHVIATITCTSGRRADFLVEFKKIVPLVLAEDGCLAYGPTIDHAVSLPVPVPTRPDTVIVIEQWRDTAALKAHLSAPHMISYRERVTDLVNVVAIQVLEPA